jgi:AAA+ ATPase superfamily predicted ATPase
MAPRPIDAFVGRQEELRQLDRALEDARRSGRGTLLSMRGRRRVGKSRLVEEFIERSGCPSVFYTPVQGPGPQELERFLAELAASDAPAGEEARRGATANAWEAALALATRGATRDDPVILVIDELPYLVEKEPTIEATLQLVWDRTFSRQPVVVVLVGSDRATMEALTEEGHPLYDRAREMVVRPLDVATIGKMLDLAPREALDAYTVIGGFPVLALEWGRGRAREEYLDEALTDPTSFLVVSAERALAAEFPSDANARAVLSAIGSDARAHGAIQARTGLPQTSFDRALGLLVDKEVVQRRTPYSARASTRNPRYIISDPYMRFWLRFVGPAADVIERGRGQVVADAVRREFSTFRGRSIESAVRGAIERMLPDARFAAAAYVGGYWNRTGAIEVDLVGGDHVPVARTVSFVGSIKWGDGRAFRRADAGRLASHRAQVPGANDETLLVGVSRDGFDADVQLDVRLGPEDIVAAC